MLKNDDPNNCLGSGSGFIWLAEEQEVSSSQIPLLLMYIFMGFPSNCSPKEKLVGCPE